MASVVLAGLGAALGTAAAAGTGLFFATLFSVTGLTAFAIGAGLSLVSRALMPKPDLGTQMGGQSVMTREAAHSRKIIYGRARIGGNVVYLESTGDDNKYLWLVVAVAGHEIDAYEEVWFNDEKIWDGSYVGSWASAGNTSTSPWVYIGFHKGDQTEVDSSLDAASTKWTSDHKLLNTAYMVVKLTYDQEQFGQGLPNISTVIRGKKVYDAQKDSTSAYYESSLGVSTQRESDASTWQWSQNPALCVRDYLVDTKYGLAESVSNISASSIDTATDVCNEAVDLAAGGTQPRYTMDGVVDTANSIKSNIENMVGSMIGRLVYSGGKFEIHAGEYIAPTVTIDESMMIGEISVQTKQSRRSAYNGVKGVFLSEEDNYILADYPAQISSTYAAQDGDPIYLDMPLPYTVNNVRAQRIAQLALRRSRQQESITIPCNLNALKFKIGDNISVTNTRLGYSAKVFEVVGYSMGFSSDQMVVNVDAIETASSIWSWDEDEEVFLGAGEVDIYDGTSTTAPASITVTADTFISSDGTSSASFDVSWPTSVDAFVDHYVVEWKVSTDSSYFSQSTKTSPLQIVGLDPSKTYDVRVKAVNGLAVSSSYVSAQAVPATDTTAPNAPTSVNAKNEFEQATISWVNPTAKDFSHVVVYGSNSETTGFLEIGTSAGTTFTEPELGTGVTRYYKLKAVDKTGNSSNYSSVDSATTTQVPSGGIADGAVDTDQIADLAVETDQIDNDAVTIAKVAASLQSTNYVSGSAGWKIQKSGVVEFEEATIRGEITASTGVIGGFTVGSDSLIAGANATRVSLSTADGIHLGHNTFASAPFRVDRAGALTATSATITGNITATDLNVVNATVTGSFVANNLPNLQNMNGAVTADEINVSTLAAINADMGTITAGSISVGLLTGDVTEVYPLMLYLNTLLTTTDTVIASWSLPAPSLSLSKRQKLSFNAKFLLENTNNSTPSTNYISFDIEKKSKGVNAQDIGTVTLVSFSNYQGLIYVSGNKLGIVDGVGGIGDSASPSSSSNVLGVYYDSATNRTYINYGAFNNPFSTGDTCYYSDSKFTSAGTWVTPSDGFNYAVKVPEGTGSTINVNIPIELFFGTTNTATDFRIQAEMLANIVSGHKFTVSHVRGTMENIA